MATPFSGEEFYAKRSFFTSLLGLKIGKSSSKNSTSSSGLPQPNNYIPNDEPCSSKSLFRQPQPVSQPLQEPYKLSAGDFPGRERSLSEQLADTLLLASPEPPREPIQSPHDIYKEIVCECAHFEQQPAMHVQGQQPIIQQNLYSPVTQTPQTYYGPYASPEMQIPYSTPTSPSTCPHCYHSPALPKKTVGVLEELAGKTSLEDLVKLVVAAVKDAGMLGKSDRKQESPEEILRRKRQQNNEAAARYRRRQREAKLIASTELDALHIRNNELRKELGYLQDQINKTKAELSQRRVLKTDSQTP
ncbi:hypothetical protein FO519_002096 [Halicephalobus sp. NKZ332]|nr:hypothetical protein FO519_002096 [Halicephalobus sp. NKZ332]